MTEARPPALVSIHDLMPETLDDVEDAMRRLREHGVGPVTLLVVPGCRWRPQQLRRLKQWAAEGHELAAHGWRHRARHIRGLRHRLHALLISRRVAEHLALRPPSILRLLRHSKAWFARQGLPAPNLYVPPAWALGPLGERELRRAPFAHIETLRGLRRMRQGDLRALPLLGFEADTALRAAALAGWNAWQLWRARQRPGEPLRIAIHPQDFQLKLSAQLDRLLQQPFRFMLYSELVTPAAPR